VKAKANAEVVRVDSRLAVFVLRAKKELTVGEEICWSYGFNPVTDEDYEGTYFEEVENGVTAYEGSVDDDASDAIDDEEGTENDEDDEDIDNEISSDHGFVLTSIDNYKPYVDACGQYQSHSYDDAAYPPFMRFSIRELRRSVLPSVHVSLVEEWEAKCGVLKFRNYSIDRASMTAATQLLLQRAETVHFKNVATRGMDEFSQLVAICSADEWDSALGRRETVERLVDKYFANFDEILLPCMPDKNLWVLVRLQIWTRNVLVYYPFRPIDPRPEEDPPMLQCVKEYIKPMLNSWDIMGLTELSTDHPWSHSFVGVAKSNEKSPNRLAVVGLTVILYVDALLEQYYWPKKEQGVHPILLEERTVDDMKAYSDLVCYALVTGLFPY
jgi:hypothetical protein